MRWTRATVKKNKNKCLPSNRLIHTLPTKTSTDIVAQLCFWIILLLLFIYFVAIGVSLIYKLIIECMPQYYILTDNNQVNELLSGIALFIYFVYSIRVVYELKSIIGNTLLLFRTSIQFRILSFEKSETSDLQNEECSSNNVANRE